MADLDFLVGIWKVENKESYEAWTKKGKNRLEGSVYKIKKDQKKTTEKLEINKTKGGIIYEATVLNQNDGKTVPFSLSTENLEWISFENKNHDFPKKIQYKQISKDTLQVKVLGDNGLGFSYTMTKQKD